MSITQLFAIAKAGGSVWANSRAIMREGCRVDDPRLLQQSQVMASAVMALLGAIGLSVPSAYVQSATLVVLAIYALWSGAATLASTDKLGLTTVLSLGPSPAAPAQPVPLGAVAGQTGSGRDAGEMRDQSAAVRGAQVPPPVSWPDKAGNPWD